MTKRSENTGGHAAAKDKLHKITLYVRPDQIVKLEEIQLSERRRTGRKPDKSGLLQDAIDLLIERYRAAGHALS